ncbi:MAG: putative selenium-dependent hydroxylase accessory protein YqeC, partial [Acidiferrobacterales bacterium]
RVLNVPLSERTAHRVEQIERVSGAKRGQLLTPLHLARLIADEQGLLKSVGNANVIPLINMVETAEVKVLAFETAAEALGLTRRFDRIVLACMRSADPIIQVVRR